MAHAGRPNIGALPVLCAGRFVGCRVERSGVPVGGNQGTHNEEPISLHEAEVQARQKAEDGLVAEIGLARRGFDLMLRGLNLLRGHQVPSDSDHLILSLTIRSFNALYVAHEDLLNGYPVQSLTLVRSAFEDFVTATYVHGHPNKATFWLDKKYLNQKESNSVPKFRNMWEDISKDWTKNSEIDSAGKFAEEYHILSQIGHPRFLGLFFDREISSEGVYYRLGPNFDRELAMDAYYLLLPRIVANAAVVGLFLVERDQAWVADVRSYRDEIIHWLQERNRDLNTFR